MSRQLASRQLGASNLSINPIGFGLMSLSGTYGAADDKVSVDLIQEAIDKGVNFLDSSDMYGWGHNETLLGTALKGRREQVVLASKFGNFRKEDGTQGVDGRPEYVRSACEASLKRLQVEAIDLYYAHRIDPNVPIEETVGAMANLVAAGKVRALGLCEASPATIRRAHATHPIAAVQTEYSLLYREPAEQTMLTTRELGISFVAYAPLGRSLLTGTVKSADDVASDRRKDHPRFQAENLVSNLAAVAPLQAMAEQKACTPGQLAMAWILAQGDDVVVIPGTKRSERLVENIGTASVELTVEEINALSELFPAGVASGTRYPAGGMKGVFI
jgi:aryl-alcohol dehydrogenase-like predicted oxidoreductase